MSDIERIRQIQQKLAPRRQQKPETPRTIVLGLECLAAPGADVEAFHGLDLDQPMVQADFMSFSRLPTHVAVNTGFHQIPDRPAVVRMAVRHQAGPDVGEPIPESLLDLPDG